MSASTESKIQTIHASITDAFKAMAYLRGRRDALRSVIENMKKELSVYETGISDLVELVSKLDNQIVDIKQKSKAV